MDHWRVELGDKDKYLGVVEAEGDAEAVWLHGRGRVTAPEVESTSGARRH
jgi:hypothetical protein